MNNLTTDQIATIIAAATERAGEQWTAKIGINPSKLHLMAYSVEGKAKNGELLTAAWTQVHQDADFIANAPRTIIALAERIRELEAQRDALQAEAEEKSREAYQLGRRHGIAKERVRDMHEKAAIKIDDSSLVRPDEPRENYNSRGNPMPPCPVCKGSGYIWNSDDSGHDWQSRCHVCTPYRGLERYD